MMMSSLLVFAIVFVVKPPGVVDPVVDPIVRPPGVYHRYPSIGAAFTTQDGHMFTSIGKRFALGTIFDDDLLKAQLGVDINAWNTLNRIETDHFKLMFSDFLIAVPVMLRFGNLSAEIKFSHVSSHLGDGLFEFAALAGLAPRVFSKDFLTAFLSFDFKFDHFSVQEYVEGGWIHKATPDGLERLIFNFGGDVKFFVRKSIAYPWIAYDLSLNKSMGFDSGFNSTFQAGVALNGLLNNLRIAFVMYSGLDHKGQLYDKKIQYYGAGIFFD